MIVKQFLRFVGKVDKWWTAREKASLGALCEHADGGFCKIRPREFKTRSIEDIKRLVSTKLPADWSEFEQQMNCFLDNQIDMFPYADSLAACRVDLEQSTSAEGNSDVVSRPSGGAQFLRSLWFAPGMVKPMRFQQIQAAMIERRFPGGRSQDMGDGDFRDLISALRFVFARNYTHLVGARRDWQICTSLALIVILSFSIAPHLVPIPAVTQFGFNWLWALAAGAVAIGLACWRFNRLQHDYESAIIESCSNVRTGAHMRQQELVALLPLVFAEVDREKFEFKSRGLLDQWPMEIKKWSKVAFWIDGRVEYNELFMQVEMWRIRRIHYWVRWVGVMSTALILAGFLAAAGFIFVSGQQLGDISLRAAVYYSIASALLLYLMAYATANFANSDFNLIEETLRTRNMKGRKDTQLDFQLAEFMFREKSAQLHEEEKISGKR